MLYALRHSLSGFYVAASGTTYIESKDPEKIKTFKTKKAADNFSNVNEWVIPLKEKEKE